MPNSQNLRFIANSPPPDEFEHPLGEGLMRRLCGDLAAAGWTVSEIDDWRDCGWRASCQRGPGKLAISLANIEDSDWMLQIADEYRPGCLGKLFGKVRSATPAAIFELAVAVHRALAAADLLGKPRWCWDGFPEDGNSTAEPEPARNPDATSDSNRP